MGKAWVCRGLLIGLLLSLVLCHQAGAWYAKEWQPSRVPEPSSPTSEPPAPDSDKSPSVSIEAVVINPYRSANVGALVGGLIEVFHFEEGDFVKEGEVVCEIDPKRYKLLATVAEERLKELEVILGQSEEKAKLKQELLELDSTTRQEVTAAKAEAEVARHRVTASKRELELAKFELDSCTIKAPFNGYLAVRYKHPDETAERFETIFSIVDSAKVHAVANVPESLLKDFKKGGEAYFIPQDGDKIKGTIDRIGTLVDPRSKTKRIYLLIDNSDGKLEIGTTGSLHVYR
ncbi:efflux RND transporter periplasmic adaptor subunit [Thermodesulfobacteriota bacterium]